LLNFTHRFGVAGSCVPFLYRHGDWDLYFDSFVCAQTLDTSWFHVALAVRLRNGRPATRYPDASFTTASAHFNFLIAPADENLPRSLQLGCVGTGNAGRSEIRLFRRPGVCN